MSRRTTMWVGHATGKALVVAAVITLAIGAVVLLVDSVLGAVICAGVAAVLMVVSRITVMIDRRGLTVLYSRFSWPRTFVALDDIVSVEEVSLSAATWGGWGYRGSRKAMRRAAVLIRGGEGVRVEISDGSTLSVSVDGAADAVEALQELTKSE